jgi:hypothetical protein
MTQKPLSFAYFRSSQSCASIDKTSLSSVSVYFRAYKIYRSIFIPLFQKAVLDANNLELTKCFPARPRPNKLTNSVKLYT